MKCELATKEDIELLKTEIRRLEQIIDLKLKLWSLILIALILFTNRGTLEGFLKLIG